MNGAITDEYADVLELKNTEDIEKPFYVNRLERTKQPNGKFDPVLKKFAKYNEAVFHSDLDHPTAKENWLGYFPQPDDPHSSCIMDRFTNNYRFDEMIGNFMYDRLVAKLNRPKK